MTAAARGALLAALRLALVAAALVAFGFWWTHQKAADFTIETRVRLPVPAGTRIEPALRLNGVEREALVVPCGRTLSLRVRVPGDDPFLRFQDGHLSAHPVLSLRLLREDGERVEVETHPTLEGAWTPRRVALPAAAGDVVTLELAALDGTGKPGLGSLFLADLVLESDGRGVDETEIPLVGRGLEADLLARRGDELVAAPPSVEEARAELPGPPCLALPPGGAATLDASSVPADGRLVLVLHVARPNPRGPAEPGAVEVRAGDELLATLPFDVPGELLASEQRHVIEFGRFAGHPVDLALSRRGGENLFVGLREAWISSEREVPRRRRPPDQPSRNVLLVMVDALRGDRLGCQGYAGGHTPVLDALAARGGRYERVLAPSSWTLPNAATLLTGSSPLTHGLGLEPGRVLSPRLYSLAQSAAWSGVTTACFGNSPWVSPATGLDQGFETFSTRRVPAEVVVEEALDWMADRRDFPWFLVLHFADPSYPYEPLPRDLASLPVQRPLPELVERLRPLDSRPGLAEKLAMEVGPLYDAEVAGVDRALGNLLDALGAEGMLEDTLVAVVGLEGEEFFEHGGRTHGQSLWDEVVSVPAILAGPGVHGPDGGPFVARDPVELVDVATLVASLGGLSVRSRLQGRLPPPFSPALPDPTAHALLRPFGRMTERDLDATRSRRWLRLFDRTAGTESLYDLEADPGATRDLLSAPDLTPEQATQLRFEADSLAAAFRQWQRGSLGVAAAQVLPVGGPP